MHQLHFNAPDIIRHTKKNYSIYETIENTTNDNKPSGTRSLTLSVSIEENADNFDSILEEFKQWFSSLQSTYYWDSLQLGRVPSFESISGKDFTDIIKEKRKTNKIVTKVTSIDKNLIGLLCYDLYKSGKKLDDAAIEVASIYDNNLGSKLNKKDTDRVDTIRQYYNDTQEYISNIQHTLAEL